MKDRSRYLPPTTHGALLCVVALLAALYALAAIALTLNAGRAPISLAAAVPFAALSWGMWRLKRWARWITVPALWFCVIVVPIGVLNPFAAMEWEGGAPPLASLAPWVGFGIVIGLGVLHVLGKHRADFTW
jgi:hypothetical protein